MGTISSTNYRRIFLLNICPNFRINFFQDMEVQYRMLKRNKLKLKYTLRNIEVVHKSAIIFRIIFFWIIEDLRFQQYNDNIRLFHWIYDHSTQEVSTSWKIRGLPRVYGRRARQTQSMMLIPEGGMTVYSMADYERVFFSHT